MKKTTLRKILTLLLSLFLLLFPFLHSLLHDSNSVFCGEIHSSALLKNKKQSEQVAVYEHPSHSGHSIYPVSLHCPVCSGYMNLFSDDASGFSLTTEIPAINIPSLETLLSEPDWKQPSARAPPVF